MPDIETRTIKAVKWGHRLFMFTDRIRVEISPDPNGHRNVRARNALYPPISGNGHSNEAAWNAWRKNFAESYDRAVEGDLPPTLADAILGMVRAEVFEYPVEKG